MLHRFSYPRKWTCCLLVCLIAAVWFNAATVHAADQRIVSILNARGADIVNRGTHFELTVPGDVTDVSFDVYTSGFSYVGNLFFRVLVNSGNPNPVLSASPVRTYVEDSSAKSVTLQLNRNNTQGTLSGEILLDYAYETGDPSPGQVVIRVNQLAVGAELSGGNTGNVSSGGEEEFVRLLQSSVRMPGIVIDGDAAILTYSTSETVSWGDSQPQTTLRINDISILDAHMPLPINGWRPVINGVEGSAYDIVLPAEQINAVLAAKADDIARRILNGLVFKEDPGQISMDFIGLIPATASVLPDGADISLDHEAYYTVGGGEARLMGRTANILANLGKDDIIEAHVFYRGIESNVTADLIVALSRQDYFPISTEMASSGISLADGDDADIILEDLTGDLTENIGGLIQSYDRATGMFLQMVPDSISFLSSVPNGMTTGGTVTLRLPAGMTFSLTRDDEAIDYLPGQSISQSGSYRLLVGAKTGDGAAAAAGESGGESNAESLESILSPLLNMIDTSQTCEFSFRIVQGSTNSLMYYNTPQGFRLTNVSFNGKSVEPSSPFYHRVKDDGSYVFEMESIERAAGDPVELETAVQVSRKLPVAIFDTVGNGLSTAKPVSFRILTENAQMHIRKDNVGVSAYNNILDAPGHYDIEVTDAAGNTAYYNFWILYTLNMSGWTSFILIFLLVGGVCGYLVYVRRHLRVR